ncbi:MAG: hypothetical protein N2C14_12020, partial [Planctomycetales bacterium]
MSDQQRGSADLPPVLDLEGLRQKLVDRERRSSFEVLVEQRLTVQRGDFVVLLGPSGCGKTTLL